MTTQLAFQSSLPRAGSTLFSNIVGKNPAFHVTPTSGLLDLLYVARGQFSRGEEFKAQGREEMDRAFIGFCRGCLAGKTDNVANQRGYCNCMVSSYNSRYDGKTLSAISQIANASVPGGPALVNLMMQPEAKKCVARF